MSIKALNWATEIYVGDGHAKSLLRAIANYADENGHCFPSLSQLSQDTEFSVDTCRRRIGWLEERGLLTTFACWMDEKGIRNRDRRGRETTKEIRLAVGKHPVRPTEIDGENAIGESDSGVAGSKPQDVVEGSPAARDGVPPARPGVAIQPPPSEPSSNQDSPPNPLRGVDASANTDESEPEHFAEFWAAYPGHEVMRRPKALEKFRAMSPAEREHARAAVLLYAEQLRKMNRKPLNAHLWLDGQGWKEFPKATLAQIPPERVFVPAGSTWFRAIEVAFRMLGLPMMQLALHQGQQGVWQKATNDTPDLRALAAFRDVPSDQWKSIATENSNEYFAWRRFLGGSPKLQEISVLNASDEPVVSLGVRTPSRWPPRKDGTFSETE